MLNTRNVRLVFAGTFAVLAIAFALVTPAVVFADTAAATDSATAATTATGATATDSAASSANERSTKVRNRLSEEQQKSLVRNLKTKKDDNSLLPSFLDKHELTDRNRDNKMF